MTELPWLLFLGASLAVILSPGQDMVLVLSRGLSQGGRAGVITAAGISTGLIGHTALAAYGVAALVAASEFAFVALKGVGAGYLTWLGARLILTAGSKIETLDGPDRTTRQLLTEGAVANLTNVKVIMFYFAFLPQFVPTNSAAPTRDIVALGLAFGVLTFVVKGPVGLFAGKFSAWIREHPIALTWTHRLSGIVLIGFGARLLFSDRS